MLKYGEVRSFYAAGDIKGLVTPRLPIWIQAHLSIKGDESDAEYIKFISEKKPEALKFALARRIEGVYGVLYETLIRYYFTPEITHNGPEQLIYRLFLDYNVLDLDELREFIFRGEYVQSGIYFDSTEAFKATVLAVNPMEIYFRCSKPVQMWRCKKYKKNIVYPGDDRDLMFQLSFENFELDLDFDLSTELWNLFKVTAAMITTYIKSKSVIVYDGSCSLHVYIEGSYIDNIRELLLLGKNELYPIIEDIPFEFRRLPNWDLIEPIGCMRYPGSVNHSTGRICMRLDNSTLNIKKESILNIVNIFN